jgi:hypothetical protein
VFRVAISDRRILSCDGGTVTFSHRKSGSRRWRKTTLSAMEFIRRFLQHVLPGGFQKVRHYGFTSPNSKQSIESVRWVVTLHYDLLFLLLAQQPPATPQPRIRCAACEGAMIVVGFVSPKHRFAARGPPPVLSKQEPAM